MERICRKSGALGEQARIPQAALGQAGYVEHQGRKQGIVIPGHDGLPGETIYVNLLPCLFLPLPIQTLCRAGNPNGNHPGQYLQ